MEVGGQRHAPAALPPGKTQYPMYRRLGGPQGLSGRVQKISPPPGFDHRPVQPVATRYTGPSGTRRFITKFTRAHLPHLWISWVGHIQSKRSHLRLGRPRCLFPSSFAIQTLSLSHGVPHDSPISSFLIWSSEKYLVRSTDHEAPSIPCHFLPPRPQPSPSAPSSHTPLTWFFPQCKRPSFTPT
jgi:hypothetical protein